MLESAVDRVGREVRTGILGPETTVTQMKAAVCREASLLFKDVQVYWSMWHLPQILIALAIRQPLAVAHLIQMILVIRRQRHNRS